MLEVGVAGRGGADRDAVASKTDDTALPPSALARDHEDADDDAVIATLVAPRLITRGTSPLSVARLVDRDQERADRDAGADRHHEPPHAGSHDLLAGDEADEHDGDEGDAQSDVAEATASRR